MYYDRRNDPDDHRNDVFYTWSADGAQTFAPAVRLNRESFDSRIGARYQLPYNSDGDLVEFGGRLGLLSTDSGALAAWTDTRMAYRSFTPEPSQAESDQSIYTAHVHLAAA
jgi:hypothetical protein